MKYFLTFTIIIVSLLISACSFSIPFVVINSSEGQLEIYYELKPSGMMPHENVRKPLVASVQEFNSGDFQWRGLPSDKFVLDLEKGIVKAIIQPNEVLQIESEDSIDVDQKPSEHFDIKKLSLNGTSGLVTYEGNQIYKQFKREEKSWFSPGELFL
jgi:hypothetical protein